MAEYAKKISSLIKERRASRSLLHLRFRGFLYEQGWFDSVELQRPVDRDGKPLPWVSYAFILFIQSRLKKEMRLFEFGAGNSTLFYANRVGFVVSVEHDQSWFQIIRRQMPANVNLLRIELEPGGKYCTAAMRPDGPFDIIVVDGQDRVACMKHCIPALSPSGVVVLDDSERPEYMEGNEYLKQNHFKMLDFWGNSPGNVEKKCTSIFYRPQNCLDI